MFLFALAACDPQTSSKTPVDTQIDDTGDSGGGDSGDSTDTQDTDTGDSGDTGGGGTTTGPDLPDCTPQTGSGSLIALSGVVLTVDGPVAGSVVYDSGTGLVTCVGSGCDTSAATVVCTEGVISPGLIDPHNHLQYNSLPVWDVGPEFGDRYDWQDDSRYDDFKTAYNEIKSDYDCEIMQWAEAREVIHGATAAVGSSGGSCIDSLIRNLDEDSDASKLDNYNLDYSSSNVTSAFDESDASSWSTELASGSTDAVINHVAEGKDGNVRDEIDYMFDIGAVGPGEVYVHISDASTEQLAEMAATGTSFIWSPRSNLALYGTTTPVEIAQELGVDWALGADWTPSGSMGPVRELTCADEWLKTKGSPLSDVELWRKSTEDAARVVGLDGVLGQLGEGMPADITVFDWSSTPYQAIIDGSPQSVRLVIVGGEAQYGKQDLMTSLGMGSGCDTLDVCGDSRLLCLDDGTSIEDVEATLESAMSGISMPSGYEYAAELFPLFECEDSRDSCDLSAPSSGDDDGDGIADSGDVCVGVYDPNQWDSDGDGIGDSCDACPLTEGTDCMPASADVDGDGIANEDDNCEYVGNPDQTDSDGDQIGDACDACPDEPNPGGEGCTATAWELHDGTFAVGSAVSVDDLVVSGIADGIGFAAQDSTGGIFIYDSGANAVAIGDHVDVTGTTSDYYSWLELVPTEVTVTSTGSAPTPIVVDACDLGAGMEAYESMLVEVTGVSTSNLNPDDPSDYDEFQVDSCLRVDDYFYKDLDQPTAATSYASITGVYFYSFDNYKIGPTSAADLVE